MKKIQVADFVKIPTFIFNGIEYIFDNYAVRLYVSWYNQKTQCEDLETSFYRLDDSGIDRLKFSEIRGVLK